MLKLLAIPAVRGVAILALGLALAALLEAEGLRKQAEIQPAGAERNLALALTRPLVDVSRALHLTTPRHELQVAIGRQGEDQIDAQVHLQLRPVPKPKPRPVRPAGPAQPPRFTAAHPLRVWVAGDSLAEVPGQALERLGGAIDVVGVESRLSTGLARPDLYNWFTRLQVVPRTLRPRVAVLSFGADDAHDFMTGVPAGRKIGLLGSPSWNAEYRRRVDGVTRELAADGIDVVWLGLPIPAGAGFRRSYPVVNRILESVVRAHPKAATFIDTWDLLADPHGRYTPYLRVHGTLTLMRQPDGVHYTQAAGDLIAAQVLAHLRARFRLG
ncbi:MAG TPA: DUF459 domain-containing protein [Gaiellaceae bacterium]|nr:DUF459 domain-containing protein [Gaiellaceae bacterium]